MKVTRSEFEASLRMRLQDLPVSETDRYVEFYMEMINDRIDEGMDEGSAVAAVGHLDDIEARIRSERMQPLVSRPMNSNNRRRGLSGGAIAAIIIGCIIFSPLLLGLLGLAIGLVFGLFGLVFGLFVSVIAIYISFYALTAAGFGLMVISIFPFTTGRPANGVFLLGAGFFLCGISILIIMAMNRLLALIFRGSGRMFSAMGARFSRGGGAR